MNLQTQNTSQTFTNIIAGKIFGILFQKIVFDRKIIHCTSQGKFKSSDVSTTLNRVDVVHETVKILLIRIIILHRKFNESSSTNSAVIYRIFIDSMFLPIQKFDEFTNSALEMKMFGTLVSIFIETLVSQIYLESPVQKCKFTQTMFQSVIVEMCDCKNFFIRHKMHSRAGFFGFSVADNFQRRDCIATRKFNLVNFAVSTYFNFHARR